VEQRHERDILVGARASDAAADAQTMAAPARGRRPLRVVSGLLRHSVGVGRRKPVDPKLLTLRRHVGTGLVYAASKSCFVEPDCTIRISAGSKLLASVKASAGDPDSHVSN
jgi:hypothetical protein